MAVVPNSVPDSNAFQPAPFNRRLSTGNGEGTWVGLAIRPVVFAPRLAGWVVSPQIEGRTDTAMIDFDVQKCTRRCAKTDRELQPGEVIYSVLIAEGANVVRQDFCEDGWDGPPDDAIAHWKSVTPEPNTKKANWAPNDVMLDFFVQLENQAAKQDIRYILTLLMIRRRIFKLEDTRIDQAGNEIMVVFCSRNDTEYTVPAIVPTRQRASEIQDELAHLLDTDAA